MIQGNQVRTQLATDEVRTSIQLGSGRPWGACSALPPSLCIADSRVSRHPEAWLRCFRVVSILLPDGLLTSSVTLTTLVSLLRNLESVRSKLRNGFHAHTQRSQVTNHGVLYCLQEAS